MNTEEVYRNLRKTTAEIQNYSFESNQRDLGIGQMGGNGLLQRGGLGAIGAGGDHHMTESFSAMSTSTCTLVPNGNMTTLNGGTNGSAAHAAMLAFEAGQYRGIGSGDCDLSPSTATTTESSTPENTVQRMDSMNGTRNGSNRGHHTSGGGVVSNTGRSTPDFTILEDGTLVFESELELF